MQAQQYADIVLVRAEDVPVVERRVKSGYLAVNHRAQRLPLAGGRTVGWSRGYLPEAARRRGCRQAFFYCCLVGMALHGLHGLQPFYGLALLSRKCVALLAGKRKQLLQLALRPLQRVKVAAVAFFAEA